MNSIRFVHAAPVIVACLALPLDISSSALAMCRTDVLATAATYETWPYYVTVNNVGPAIPCYYQGDTNCYDPTVPVGGPYYGVPYSYRYGDWMPALEIQAQLADGAGAGNHKCLCVYSGQDDHGRWPCTTVNRSAPACVASMITGIDCSSLVSAAWDAPRFGTNGIPTSIAQPVAADHPENLRVGDALVKARSHMVLLASGYNTTGHSFDTYEASGSAGQVIYNQDEPYENYRSDNYIPYVANVVKDDPASQVARLDLAVVGNAATVGWETIAEMNTDSFSIWRSVDGRQPYIQVSDDIPARGVGGAGADYEFTDVAPAGTDALYRLVERESTGRVIQHGTRSVREAVAGSAVTGGPSK